MLYVYKLYRYAMKCPIQKFLIRFHVNLLKKFFINLRIINTQFFPLYINTFVLENIV